MSQVLGELLVVVLGEGVGSLLLADPDAGTGRGLDNLLLACLEPVGEVVGTDDSADVVGEGGHRRLYHHRQFLTRDFSVPGGEVDHRTGDVVTVGSLVVFGVRRHHVSGVKDPALAVVEHEDLGVGVEGGEVGDEFGNGHE